MEQTFYNRYSGLKPFNCTFSAKDPAAAIKWLNETRQSGGIFEIEDTPTGDYVKAYFTAGYDSSTDNQEEITGFLVHDVLTALQTCGVDIASVKYITGVCECPPLVYMVLPEYCMENGRYSFEYKHTIETENDLIGFVRKGTPIIPKDICDLIEDSVKENRRFDCDELLVRRFLYENREKLINGETFTIGDMEDSGIIDIYRKIYPNDIKNIILGKTIRHYCEVKSKANSKVASNQRRKYRLKKDMIKHLLK
jgi:hypothetical protein